MLRRRRPPYSIGRPGGVVSTYLLPVGFATHHVHAGESLLEQAGFRLARRSQGNWEAFCAFWCDQVQPAMRRALGRDDAHAGI
jgi:hypothetical protein